MDFIYLDIIPLNKISLDRPQSYTYQSAGDPACFCIGQLVNIPLGQGSSVGIISGLLKQPVNFSGRIKKINSLVYSMPIITKGQLELAKWLSGYYLCPLGIVLKAMTPSIPKKADLSDILPLTSKFVVKNNTSLIMGNANFRIKEYLRLINVAKNQKKQIAILTPELLSLMRLKDIITSEYGENSVAEISGNLTKIEYFNNWKDIINNKKFVIIGTRQAIFSPFKNLGLIIVDEEPNISYKQWDMNPRYDARQVASKLSELHKCGLIYGGNSFSVNTFYNYQKYKWDLLTQKNIKTVYLKLADMRDEFKAGNFTILADIIKKELYETLNNNNQAIIIVSRQGLAKFVLCRDCGFIFKCRDCSASLSLDRQGILYCPLCTYKITMPALCPVCRSVKIKDFGIGTDRVVNELKKIFPTAKISAYDRSNIKNNKDCKTIYQQFETKQIDIVVGTPAAISLGTQNVSLIAILDFDSLAYSPNWLSAEKTYNFIKQLDGDYDSSQIIIQTYNSENKLFQEAISNKFEFYHSEISERKKQHYPPFFKIVKLIFKGQDLRLILKKANLIKTKLEALIADNENKIDIIGPYKPAVRLIKNYNFLNLLIKVPNISGDKFLNKHKNILFEADQVDVDPLDLF